MPRYYRTFLATGLLTAMTLPALAQTPVPTPTSVSPAPTPKPTPATPKHHVTHQHHTVAAKKTPPKAPATKN